MGDFGLAIGADPLATVTGANRGELMLVTPALIPVTHSRDTAWDPQEPLRTITTAKGGEVAVSAATLVQLGYGERHGQAPRALDIDRPLGTVVAGGRKHGLATACLVQAGHGEGASGKERRSYGANDVSGPIGTVTATGSGGHRVATAFMVQANGGFNATPARDLLDSMSVVTTSGSQQQLIETHLQAVLQRKEHAVQTLLQGMCTAQALHMDAPTQHTTATSMVVVLTYWLSYEYVRDPRHALEPANAQQALLRGAQHVLSLLLPYLDAAQRSHLQVLTGAYAPPQTEGTAP